MESSKDINPPALIQKGALAPFFIYVLAAGYSDDVADARTFGKFGVSTEDRV